MKSRGLSALILHLMLYTMPHGHIITAHPPEKTDKRDFYRTTSQCHYGMTKVNAMIMQLKSTTQSTSMNGISLTYEHGIKYYIISILFQIVKVSKVRTQMQDTQGSRRIFAARLRRRVIMEFHFR